MSYQITDPVEIGRALNRLMDYNFTDEVRNFEEEHSIEFNKSDSIEEMIQKVNFVENGTNHILYSILVLKSAYPEIEE